MAYISLVVLVSIFVLTTLWKRSRENKRIPKGLKPLPGPKGLPIIGSVHEVPEKLTWVKFHEWGQEYGPIYQCNLAGTNHVWILSDEIARDLLSKKGGIYSDRPHIPALIDDNRTSAQYLPLLSQNDGWSRQRKFANHIMRSSEKANWHGYPELEARRLCMELMAEPDKYNHALESYISRITCRLAWGHAEASEELKQRARELLIGVSPTGAFGNKLPFVMDLPYWMSSPKAWERKRARTERKFFQIMQGDVQQEINEKRAAPSWTRLFLENPKQFGFKDNLEGAYAVGMHGIAGALTIAAPMQVFCMAMVHHPQYLAMLQEELDRVCGDRMPTQADKPNLPFLRAVIRELLRWRPPVPTGIPHALTEDDEYKGYFIPKGSVMHPLEWSISRDPALFPDPEAFNPLRWLKPEYPTYKEPLTQYPTIMNCTQFGYGRRTCQGQQVSEIDLLVGIGAVAWLFDMSKKPPAPVLNIVDPRIDSAMNTPVSEKRNSLARTPTEEKRRSVMMNTRASISHEELNQGFSPTAKSFPEVALMKKVPGTFPAPGPEEIAPESAREVSPKEEDPTLIFSHLLIAKPLPFKFHMMPRDPLRAELVREQFAAEQAKGHYAKPRSYWTEGHGEQFGWVPV